jgi:hypothetical protein
MKKNALFTLIILLLLSLVLWLSFRNLSLESSPKIVAPMEALEDQIQNQLIVEEKLDSTPNSASNPSAGSPEFWRNAYKTPMDLYGLVLDESDAPVVGARVICSWNPAEGGSEKVTIISDNNGAFSYLGRRGISLRVNVSKAGYYQIISKDASVRNLDFFVPTGTPEHLGDPNDPAIFRLKKKGEGVDLRSHKLSTKMPSSGDFKVNLMNGRISSSGELNVRVSRSANKRPYSWNASARINGGGFAKAEGQLMHEAPEAGYVEELAWSFPLKENGQPERYTFDETYYVTFGSPQKYGKVRIYLKSHTWYLIFESVVNPDGGRNLEPKDQ